VTSQLRYNEGKPKLSYYYSNLSVLDLAPESLPVVLLTGYLARVDENGLHDAAIIVRRLLGDAIEEYCAVCEYGAKKYERGNYRKGAYLSEYLDCALRHIKAHDRGEINDPESGRKHLGHAFWNLVQALDQPSWRDDRLPKVNTEEPSSK
jgi:hypothetical protein